ncbi:class I SAM-dependent methyltransferase [Pseudalkalibacillus berkeleyi]|uniref:Class I SAM-dependent methyltransferase n=1 Tax=Pseudalkalibacillus berkeleyi TaxID=1069813 RepID=A0ABS9H124_9BACL|nr:class I SAM-dependent methyltransferase [Pseudalkalibacillus berkeleyi]MCF6137711.1 class I SAM-dependent methyltransferase [Pseudalkalibacillus berkeleyi]
MKETDYSIIADKYDKNQYRIQEVKKDYDLEEYINQHNNGSYNVLDLSCGTGLYLAKQVPLFSNVNIVWNGLDASKDIKKASEKVNNVNLVHGYAENIPFETNTLDYISNNYAFHHYENKDSALDEIARVLKNDGVYKLHNIAIHKMPEWWVYKYFPSAYEEDLKRFWDDELIYQQLLKRGFTVRKRIEYRKEDILVDDYIQYAQNRDISVLTLISETDYENGLEKMEKDLRLDPLKEITNDFAELFIISKKI